MGAGKATPSGMHRISPLFSVCVFFNSAIAHFLGGDITASRDNVVSLNLFFFLIYLIYFFIISTYNIIYTIDPYTQMRLLFNKPSER